MTTKEQLFIEKTHLNELEINFNFIDDRYNINYLYHNICLFSKDNNPKNKKRFYMQDYLFDYYESIFGNLENLVNILDKYFNTNNYIICKLY
ncbi:hypothetical protein M0Q50_02225 [bacterium]|jgi:hypothetical protein|nr:hypothetical protein [bacterium]